MCCPAPAAVPQQLTHSLLLDSENPQNKGYLVSEISADDWHRLLVSLPSPAAVTSNRGRDHFMAELVLRDTDLQIASH